MNIDALTPVALFLIAVLFSGGGIAILAILVNLAGRGRTLTNGALVKAYEELTVSLTEERKKRAELEVETAVLKQRFETETAVLREQVDEFVQFIRELQTENLRLQIELAVLRVEVGRPTEKDLVRVIDNSFTLSELRTAFAGLVDFENLRGETRAEKVTAMVEYFENRHQMNRMLQILSRERPNIRWSWDGH